MFNKAARWRGTGGADVPAPPGTGVTGFTMQRGAVCPPLTPRGYLGRREWEVSDWGQRGDFAAKT